MTVFHGGADWLDDRPRRSLLLRARDVAGVALVAICALLIVLLLTVAL